ncbi:unnamed protein product [Orchesella dallaii]|uniref:Uncharacterized protein n=1 Tax=Orchesella dallaii TaxID=48710 RepID=A0ABP1RRA0_9HEXA
MALRPFKAEQKNQNETINQNPINTDQENCEGNWDLILKINRYYQAISTTMLSCFVDVLELCLAYTCMEATTRYRKYVENLLRKMGGTENKVELKRVVLICQDLKRYFHHVNQFGSEYFLCWFCMIVPWMSFRITESFPGMKGSSLDVLLYNYVFIFIYAVALLFAAETRRQVEMLVDLVHEAAFQNDDSSPANKTFMYNIKHIVKDVGLKGGNFFQYSYGFLGSTIGFVIAYAFFVFQFRVDSKFSRA